MARLGRGRRNPAKIDRAPSSPTATPLVRRRVVVELDRKPSLIGLGRQRRLKARIVAGLRYAATATPLTRKRITLSTNANERSRYRAAFLKQRPRLILRPPAPVAAVPAQRPRKPVVWMVRQRQLKARILRDKPRILRALLWSPRTRPPLTTSNAERLARLKTRRPRPLLRRAPAPRVATVRRTPIVTRQRRSRVDRAYYPRHHTRLTASTRGSAAGPAVIVLGQFDPPSPAETQYAVGVAAAAYDQPNPGQA